MRYHYHRKARIVRSSLRSHPHVHSTSTTPPADYSSHFFLLL